MAALDLKAIQAIPPHELALEIDRGGRLVIFQYCISLLVISFRRNSPVYLIRTGESATGKHLPYTLLSLFLGWWGFPWGFIYTPQAIYRNCKGGVDVTRSVYAPPQGAPPPPPLMR